MTDVSVIVTVHDETAVCGPTLRAADLAVAAARAGGLTVQTVLGLDAPTEATAAYLAQPRFDHWQRQVVEEGDLGRARNRLVADCDGQYVAFLDADDLFSENWLVAGARRLRQADATGERAIVHPELMMVFDGQRTVQVTIDQDSPLFTPHYLYLRHYYDSLGLAPRDAHLEIPYGSRDIRRGLSYQDFQWTIETMAAGWRHHVAPDTIIFKRRRDFSLVTESNDRRSLVRSLPAMAIDRVRELGRSS